MTTLANFSKTDDVDDVLADDLNRLLGGILRAEFVNAVTMSGTVTLTDADTPLQRMNCDGANRIVKLPAYATANHPFLLMNVTAATYTLEVQTNGASFLALLGPGEHILMVPDGAAGYKVLAYQTREKLVGNRTYYVRTDGNDSNSGLANTAGGAFLTMQRAVDVCVKLDLNGYAVTIQVAAGTYAGGIHMTVPFFGGTVTVVGDTVTPSNVVCSSSAPLYLENGSILYFGGFKFTSAAATYAALVSSNSTLYINGKMEYATSGALAANGFGSILISAPYTISAGGAVHYWPASNGVISASGLTITLTGTPPFSAAFAYATSMGNLSVFGNTFVGAATGKRYHADSNAVIFTDGGGANYLPGNVAGETASGGQYV